MQIGTAAGGTVNTGATSSWGCAVSSSKRWAIANAMEDAITPTDTWRVTSAGKCIHGLSKTDGTLAVSADFDGWITDGFRLDWTTNPGSTTKFSYLVINGGLWDAGTLTAPTSAINNVDYPVSVAGNSLRGLMLASCFDQTSGSIDTTAILSVGGTDGVTSSVVSARDNDNIATVDSYCLNAPTKMVEMISDLKAHEIVAVFDSFSTNNFRLDWTAAPNVQLVGWVVVADQSITTQDVKSQVVRFTKSTGGNGTTQDVTFDFTPKAIIVMSTGQTTDDTSEAHHQVIMGFSDGTTQGVTCTTAEDGVADSDAARIWRNDAVFSRLSETAPTTTELCRGSAAFSTNTVTFTWTVNDAVATQITVWAFAGDDLQAKCAHGTIGRTTAGTTDYTGLGFTPTGNNRTAIFAHTGVKNASGTITTTADFSFSCATRAYTQFPDGSDKEQWNLSTDSQGGGVASSNTSSVTNVDRNFVALTGSGAYYYYGYLYQWITDGFTIYWDYVFDTTLSTQAFTYLVLDGGYWDAGVSQLVQQQPQM